MLDPALGIVIERFALRWLDETEIGHEIVATMGIDPAIDAVFELLNSGLLKLIRARDGTPVGVRPCFPAQPPKCVLHRPGRKAQ